MNGGAQEPVPAGHPPPPPWHGGGPPGLTCSSWVPFGSSHAGALGALEVAMGIEGGLCALAAAVALVLLIVAVVDR